MHHEHRYSAIMLCASGLLALGVACKNQAPPPPPPPPPPAPEVDPEAVAVVVNGTEIKEKQLLRTMNDMAGQMGAPASALPPQVRQQLRARAEEHLVSRELLRQYALKEGLEPEPAQVDAKLKQARLRLPIGSTDADFAKLTGIGVEKMREELKTDAAIDAVAKRFREALKPTEEEVKADYEANLAVYTTADQAHISHILLRLDPAAPAQKVEEIRKQALEISTKARAGDAAAFAALADEVSQDPAVVDNHGDLGFVSRDKMPPELAPAAFALKAGEASEPVKSSFGYHVLFAHAQRAAGQRTLDEVRDVIVAKLNEEQVAKKMEALVAQLRADAKLGSEAAPASAPTPTP